MTCLGGLHGRLFVVVAIGLLLSAAAGVSLTEGQQVAILAVLVAVLGLPHGALDPAIARACGLARGRTALLAFAAAYLGLVLVVLVAWTLAPGPALAGFLTLSAWHFSGDWRHRLPLPARLAAGAALIAAPTLGHALEVGRLFAMLAPLSWANALVDILSLVALPAMALSAITALAAERRSTQAIVEVILVVLLALVLPPLVYFVAYFCFLHSPRHLIEAARLVGIGSPEQVIVRALPITCVTVIGAMIAVYLLPSMPLSTATIQVVFIGLAALTVPHMLLVERIARHRRPVAEVP